MPVGALTAGILALPFVRLLDPAEPVAVLFALAAAGAGIFFAAKWVNWYDALMREPQLEKLVGRLEAVAERMANPALGPGSDPRDQ